MKLAQYTKYGFHHLKNFFSENELLSIEPIILKFHNSWLDKNQETYINGAINSHSLTASGKLTKQEKGILFNFICSDKVINLIEFDAPRFLNTQLFFDPKNSNQNNYWHRDIQYVGISEEAQKEVIKTQNVVHLRIPLKKDPGIELIPKTHRQWDSVAQYEVRNSLNNKTPSDALKEGQLIALERSDVLVFSANMIHRGTYGNNRLSLDIIYCDNDPKLLKFRDKANLPSTLDGFKNAKIFT